MGGPEERSAPTRAKRVVAVAVVVQLLALLGAVAVLRDHGQFRTPGSRVRGRPAPQGLDVERDTAVRALLHDREEALRNHDRAAWLATVDPAVPAFRTKQAALFDRLAELPLTDWSYHLDPDMPSPEGVDLDEIRGAGWWAPAVSLSYRVTGYDEQATVEPQRLTFVPRGTSWFVAADDDFARVGRDTTRGLWDFGPVTVLRGVSCIVFGHPGSRSLLRRIAASVDAAVPRVDAVWGRDWSQRVVVLVPSSQDELDRIVGGKGDYSQIAAVATAELTDANRGYHPVGDRILINPPNFAKLGSLGRRVVLTHEVTHVATRRASGPAAPAWLVEGFADYVGYRGVHVPYSVSASELRHDLRRGRVPAALPSDNEFDGGNKDLAEVYEEAWLAVTLIADQHGRDGLLRFYRAVGRVGAPATSVDDAFASLWGTNTAAFTAAWRHDLAMRLR